VCDGNFEDFSGYALFECLMEIMIAPDKLDEEVEEVEAVKGTGLALLCEYQDGEERLEGRVGRADGFEFL